MENIKEPRAGAIALCGLNALGLITSGEILDLTEEGGKERKAWVGIQLTHKLTHVGGVWTSRNPKVICYVEDLIASKLGSSESILKKADEMPYAEQQAMFGKVISKSETGLNMSNKYRLKIIDKPEFGYRVINEAGEAELGNWHIADFAWKEHAEFFVSAFMGAMKCK